MEKSKPEVIKPIYVNSNDLSKIKQKINIEIELANLREQLLDDFSYLVHSNNAKNGTNQLKKKV
jgi:hypothetical protein